MDGFSRILWRENKQESWVMRDIWQTTNVKYGAKWGLATMPKQLQSSAIKRLIDRALWEQGIRHQLKMEKEDMNLRQFMDFANSLKLIVNK